jgi:hypothetical protein
MRRLRMWSLAFCWLPASLSRLRSYGEARSCGESLAVVIPRSKKKGLAEAKPLNLLVGRTGFEPVTNGLKVRCSTS